jgi:phosphoribosylformimino-5-aminoimidazole carboxamide ribotide isomerase
LDDLGALRSLGVAGAIVGKAIYEGRFTVEEALRACAP